MNYKAVLLVPALAMSLNACASNEDSGLVLGGILGGILGAEVGGSGTSEVFAIAIGAMAGAAIGSSIGRKLDKYDQAMMENSTQYALESSVSGEQTQWVNPDSGNSGTVVTQTAYRNDAGQYCREFQQVVMVGGEEHEAYGTACRQPDGAWKIISTR